MEISSMQKQLDKFLKRHKKLDIPCIQEMIYDYANSDLELARGYFTKQYGISQNSFYKCRDFAVTCWLVDNSICQKLKAKAVANYQSHNPNGNGIASIANFKELFQKREEYLLSIPDEFVLEIAKMYTAGKSVEEIAFYNYTSRSLIRRLLTKGITELIIDSKTVNEIIALMPDKSKIHHLIDVRERQKKSLIEMQIQEINTLKYKYANANLYCKFDSNSTVSSLNAQLLSAQERLTKMKDF